MTSPGGFFTPQQPKNYKECPRCGPSTPYGLDVEFVYVPGVKGEKARMCCSPCAKHYKEKREGLCTRKAGIDKFHIPIPLVNDWTQVSDAHLRRASSASQRGEPSLPAQRFGSSTALIAPPQNSGFYGAMNSAPTMSQPVSMMPPPMFPPPHLAVRAPPATPGYTANHLSYSQHRAKMVNQVFEYNQHVTVAFSLHSLKSEGRSGTFLVRNIERDQQISPTITCIDLYNTAIRIIEPMWNNWAPGYPLPVGELEMYKIPRLLLYSPASPGAGQVALDEPAIYQFFLTVKAGRSSSTPTFSASKRIGIMLLMQNELYGEVFDWKEAREARVPAVAQAEQNRTEEDSEVAEIPGLSDVACDRILGISGQSKQGSKSTGKRSRKASNSQPTDVKSKRSTQHGQGLSARSALSSDRPESSKVQEKNASNEDENDFIIIANNDRSKPDSQVPTASCSNAIPQPIRQHIPTEGAASGGPSIVLPDIAKLRDALSKQDGARSQAKSLRKQIAINVQLFLIPALDFHTLLNKKTFVVDVNNIGDSDRHLVELFVDASNHIGLAGSFKTAHSASIKPFLPQSASVLGTPSIVAKRLFLLQCTDHDLTQQSRCDGDGGARAEE